MSKLMTAMAVIGLAASSLASTIIWTLLTEPAAMISAASSGSVWSIVRTVLGVWQ